MGKDSNVKRFAHPQKDFLKPNKTMDTHIEELYSKLDKLQEYTV